jgi:hypothetical protein
MVDNKVGRFLPSRTDMHCSQYISQQAIDQILAWNWLKLCRDLASLGWSHRLARNISNCHSPQFGYCRPRAAAAASYPSSISSPAPSLQWISLSISHMKKRSAYLPNKRRWLTLTGLWDTSSMDLVNVGGRGGGRAMKGEGGKSTKSECGKKVWDKHLKVGIL